MTSLAVKLILYGSITAGALARGDAPYLPAPQPDADLRAPGQTFAADVARLSARADAVDAAWAAYQERCAARVTRTYDFGREWFALWDHAVEPGTGPDCAPALAGVFDAARGLREDLRRVRQAASRTGVPEATVYGTLRWNTLDWPEITRGGQSASHR